MAGVLRGGSHAQQVDDCLMPRLQSVEEWRTPLFVHRGLVGHSLEKVSEPSRHRIQSHPQTRARAHATRSLALQWRGTGSALDEILMPLCSGDVQRCAPILTEPAAVQRTPRRSRVRRVAGALRVAPTAPAH